MRTACRVRTEHGEGIFSDVTGTGLRQDLSRDLMESGVLNSCSVVSTGVNVVGNAQQTLVIQLMEIHVFSELACLAVRLTSSAQTA